MSARRKTSATPRRTARTRSSAWWSIAIDPRSGLADEFELHPPEGDRRKQGIPAYLIDSAAEIRDEWLVGRTSVGVTAGASAPEVLVDQVVETLRQHGGRTVTEVPGIKEQVVFSLPRALVKAGERYEEDEEYSEA